MRPKALVAPLTLVIAAASVVGIAAGARFGIQVGTTQPLPRAVASDAGVAHDHPRPLVKTSPAPAAHQSRLVRVQARKPPHPRRHNHRPKSHRPVHSHHAKRHHTAQADIHQQLPSMALMLLYHAVLDMRAAGASRKLLDFVNQPQNLVSTAMDRHKPLRNASRIQVFNSYAGIAQALANHHIAADTRAVVYDNERSTGTPADELADPVQYCRLTANLLHQHGLKYIASPGFDLSGPPPRNGGWFQQFVQSGLMECGRYADYLDIQDQLQEGTTTYARDAQAAAKLLHQINPRAKLLMGLSTSPSGQLDTAGQLWQAYQDTSRFVSGYWLNVPHNVSGHSVPSVALQFLQKMVTQTH
jgi:hypothetical protein